MTNEDIVLKMFPGKTLLSLTEAGEAIGYKPGTCYNKINDGSFPLPLTRRNGRVYIKVKDLIAYLNGGEEVKRPRGRPRKFS